MEIKEVKDALSTLKTKELQKKNENYFNNTKNLLYSLVWVLIKIAPI